MKKEETLSIQYNGNNINSIRRILKREQTRYRKYQVNKDSNNPLDLVIDVYNINTTTINKTIKTNTVLFKSYYLSVGDYIYIKNSGISIVCDVQQ